jgi:hypothetical protein
MKRAASPLVLLALLTVLGFAWGLWQLFSLRFETGDVYPPYSSLRADPLGTKALHDSFDSLGTPRVGRSYRPLDRLEDPRGTTVFWFGDGQLELIEQPAGSGDQHVDAAIEPAPLLVHADAADQQGHRQVEMLAVGLEVGRALRRQLARRAQDERARHPRLGLARCEALDHRQDEGGGLAGPGLRDPKQVVTSQNHRDRLLLDRRRRLVAGILHRLDNLRPEGKVAELHANPFEGREIRTLPSCSGVVVPGLQVESRAQMSMMAGAALDSFVRACVQARRDPTYRQR